MTRPRRRDGVPRVGFCTHIDPALAAEVRHTAATMGVRHWWIVQEALRRGLPLLPSPDKDGLPRGAYLGHRDRRRSREALFVDISPEMLEDIGRAAAPRFNRWWVVQEALRSGLPLIPAPGQEVLPQTA